ncbi:hypothetical protein GCM10023185_07960 [Hymenobacter saemangeumensis]|uniref:T9SS type A sorting domain-containing protein n=1 Tax=Hymenobacter saemangeumensis TaxID=1084522 RepID=A0ABP8I2Y4_9BACT
MQKLVRSLILAATCTLLGSAALHAQPGVIDPTFNAANNGTSFNGSVRAIVHQPDGKLIVCGSFTAIGGVSRNRIARLHADGSLDTSFNPGTGFTNNFTDPTELLLQPDGKVVVGGGFDVFNGVPTNRIVRLNPDGSRDASFTIGTGFSFPVTTLALQADGKIMVGGEFSSYNGVRRISMARLNANGTLDAAFGTTNEMNGSPAVLVPLASGKYLVAGIFTCIGSCSVPANQRNYLARLNADGSLDQTFVPTGTGFNAQIKDLAVQPDGKVVVTGLFSTFNGAQRVGFARVNTDGSLDASFNAGAGTSFGADIIRVLRNGQFLTAGGFTTINGVRRYRIALLNADGTVDTSFGQTDGLDNSILALDVQRDGKVVVGGTFGNYYPPTGLSTRRGYLARLQGNAALPTRAAAPPVAWQVYQDAQPGLFNLVSEKPLTALRVTDALGRTVASPAPGATLDLRRLPAGVYFVQAHWGEQRHTCRVVKE